MFLKLWWINIQDWGVFSVENAYFRILLNDFIGWRMFYGKYCKSTNIFMCVNLKYIYN